MTLRLIPAAIAALSLSTPVAAYADAPAATASPTAQAEPVAPGPQEVLPDAAAPGSDCRCHRGCARAHCDLPPMTPTTRVSVEVGGAGAWLDRHVDARISLAPAALPGWSFGLGAFANPGAWRSSGSTVGTSGSGLREADSGASQGWSAAVRQGYDVSVTRYFSRRHPGGFFLAAQLSAAQVVLTSEAAPGAQARPWFLAVTPQLGFQWFPFWQRTFFLRPWFGGEFRIATLGSTTVGDATAPHPIVSPTGGLNLGLAF